MFSFIEGGKEKREHLCLGGCVGWVIMCVCMWCVGVCLYVVCGCVWCVCVCMWCVGGCLYVVCGCVCMWRVCVCVCVLRALHVRLDPVKMFIMIIYYCCVERSPAFIDRPDMTFAVDWVLITDYLSIRIHCENFSLFYFPRSKPR